MFANIDADPLQIRDHFTPMCGILSRMRASVRRTYEERTQCRRQNMNTQIMTSQKTDRLAEHEIVSRADWLVARKDLLKRGFDQSSTPG
jgi:hypothetical protein